MRDSTDQSPLTTTQQCVVNALAAGATLSDAAEQCGVHRATVYRWLNTRQEFTGAVRQARADFVLTRRDDLFHLSNRALETLLAILDNPKTPPSVLYKTAVFILTRPQSPKTGWSMPEPTPAPDGQRLTDSSTIEQDYEAVPNLDGIEPDESAAPEKPAPSPASDPAGATECDEMRHDSPVFEDVAPPAPLRFRTLRSLPVPPELLHDPEGRARYLQLCDELDAVQALTIDDLKSKAGKSENGAL